jgi:hypothetical protein
MDKSRIGHRGILLRWLSVKEMRDTHFDAVTKKCSALYIPDEDAALTDQAHTFWQPFILKHTLTTRYAIATGGQKE